MDPSVARLKFRELVVSRAFLIPRVCPLQSTSAGKFTLEVWTLKVLKFTLQIQDLGFSTGVSNTSDTCLGCRWEKQPRRLWSQSLFQGFPDAGWDEAWIAAQDSGSCAAKSKL